VVPGGWENVMSPISLTDSQLALVMTAARPLSLEKRSAFLERIAARLRLVGYRKVADDDVERAIGAALRGLLQAPAA
jgi:hypothetical protein